MAMVLSSRSKMVTVIVVTGFGLVLVLIIGGTVGWFDADAAPDYSFPKAAAKEKLQQKAVKELLTSRSHKCCKSGTSNQVFRV